MSNNHPYPLNNGSILTITQIIKAVISSTAEGEIGALYINSRKAIPASHTLKEMGHPQPPKTMQTNNTASLGIITNIIQPKCSKAMKCDPTGYDAECWRRTWWIFSCVGHFRSFIQIITIAFSTRFYVHHIAV